TPVTIVPGEQPLAFALPARYGGIVLSASTVSELDAHELRSVLAHERAHLNQRHHLISEFLAVWRVIFGWVPAIRSACQYIDDCMEIAADDVACKEQNPRALAGALLKLGTAPNHASLAGAQVSILNAAGLGRIAHLVSPRPQKTQTGALLLVSLPMLTLGLISLSILWPYASLLITGCL